MKQATKITLRGTVARAILMRADELTDDLDISDGDAYWNGLADAAIAAVVKDLGKSLRERGMYRSDFWLEDTEKWLRAWQAERLGKGE